MSVRYDIPALDAHRLEEMVTLAVSQPQEGQKSKKTAHIIPFSSRTWLAGSGGMALAASVVVAVSLLTPPSPQLQQAQAAKFAAMGESSMAESTVTAEAPQQLDAAEIIFEQMLMDMEMYGA